MSAQMNPQVFLAIATVAWANGDLSADERAGILNAARSVGYSEGDLGLLSKGIEMRRELSSLSLHRFSALDRVFAYAASEWLARLEGTVGTSEQAALDALSDFLKIAPDVRDEARAAVLEISRLPSGDRPERYDFLKLREVLDGNMRARSR